VTPGTPVHDTATVNGNQPSKTPSGNVTFFLCGPIATGACDGTTNVGTNIGTAPLSGSGGTASATSADQNTGAGLTPGRYCFRAEWPGDANYTTPLKEYGRLSGTNECFTVQQVPSSTSSAQTWLPNDSATVTSTLPLSGSLSFTLHDGGDCTGAVLRPAETYTFSGATSSVTRSTTNSSVSVTTSSTVSWESAFPRANHAWLAPPPAGTPCLRSRTDLDLPVEVVRAKDGGPRARAGALWFRTW